MAISEQINVMTAYLSGATIEQRFRLSSDCEPNEWAGFDGTKKRGFNFAAYDYRIKLEPPKFNWTVAISDGFCTRAYLIVGSDDKSILDVAEAVTSFLSGCRSDSWLLPNSAICPETVTKSSSASS